MKALLHSGWVLLIGVVGTGAFAEDMPWRPAGTSPTPAQAAPAPQGRTATNAVSLGRPLPMNGTPADQGMQAAEFRPAVVRAQSDLAPPRPLPRAPGPLTVSDSVQNVEPDKPGTKEVIPFEPRPIPDRTTIYSAPPAGYGVPAASNWGGDCCCSPAVVCQDSCCWGRGRGWGRLFGGCGFGDCCGTPCCPSNCCSSNCCSTGCCANDCCIGDCGGGCCGGGCCTGMVGDCCGGCDAGCFDDCCCRRRPCFWVSAEYLAFSVRSQGAPPLVTASPPGTPAINAGVLNLPTTTVLFDQNNLNDDVHSGFRVTAGFWFPCYSDLGLEASYFSLGRQGQHFTASSNGNPILARPFIDARTGNEISQLVAFDGALTGRIDVDTSTRLWGAEVNFRHKLLCGPCFHFDLLYGYRHLELEDSLTITENLVALPGTAGQTAIIVRDSFATRNQFNGGQIGLEYERRLWRRWFFNIQGKIAVGDNHQVVNVAGSTVTATATGSTSVPVGVAALPSNIGQQTRDHVAVLPELNFKVGVDICDHLRAWVGYDILWLSDAVRAGDQIDRTINRTQLPGGGPFVGPVRPLVPFRQQTFWAQGVNFGLEYRY